MKYDLTKPAHCIEWLKERTETKAGYVSVERAELEALLDTMTALDAAKERTVVVETSQPILKQIRDVVEKLEDANVRGPYRLKFDESMLLRIEQELKEHGAELVARTHRPVSVPAHEDRYVGRLWLGAEVHILLTGHVTIERFKELPRFEDGTGRPTG